MKKLFSAVGGRLIVSCVFLVIQAAVIIYLLYHLSCCSVYISAAMNILSIIVCLFIAGSDSNPSFKLAWIFPILVFPVFGWMMYLTFERDSIFTPGRKKFDFPAQNFYSTLIQDESITEELKLQAPDILGQVNYIRNTSSAIVFKNTQTKYYPDGEKMFADFMKALNGAGKFIFLEYFIIMDGYMFKSILSVIKKKAAENVSVFILYDDMGSNTFKSKFGRELEDSGIKIAAFNPFRPSLNSTISYRDHRKIAVIDGNFSFTGGINLSDEYINCKERFGYWKDSGIMLQGEAVRSMTDMFIRLWNYFSDDKITQSFYYDCAQCSCDGYVQPFSDKPTQSDRTGEMAYMKIINNAKKYIYIMTPYLILDNEMLTALRLAAGSGVDVRIITPHIPDKKYVQAVTRSNYPALLKSGVRIFEFSPGFIHSKTIVSDDTTAVVGTSNFDFRSFYLLFENSVFMYRSQAVLQMKKDFDKTLGVCEEITYEKYKEFSAFSRTAGAALRLFAPLM